MIYLALSRRCRNFQQMNAISHKNWLKNKNPTIISSDAGKTSGKNPTCLHQKSPRECRSRGNTWKHNRNLYMKICSLNIYSFNHSKYIKTWNNPTEAKNQKGLSTNPTCFWYCTWSSDWYKKDIKWLQIGKLSLSLFADNMILCI